MRSLLYFLYNLLIFTPPTVLSGVESEKIQRFLHDLEDSKTIHIAYHANAPNVGMALNADYSMR